MLDTANAVTNETTVESRIVEYLESQSAPVDLAQSPDQILLLESGALDSLGVVQLTMLLADEYDIEIDDDDFVPENFESVASLANFVKAKL